MLLELFRDSSDSEDEAPCDFGEEVIAEDA
jgi:hypothetical protein